MSLNLCVEVFVFVHEVASLAEEAHSGQLLELLGLRQRLDQTNGANNSASYPGVINLHACRPNQTMRTLAVYSASER